MSVEQRSKNQNQTKRKRNEIIYSLIYCYILQKLVVLSIMFYINTLRRERERESEKAGGRTNNGRNDIHSRTEP